MKYRRDIDGLRAVAVVPVILFHGGFSLFSGGFVGVDVFFVISGYLITTILLGDMESGTYSLVRFYERRARRILPALFLVMLACIPFAWAWMLQTQLKDFFESLTVTSLFSSNFLFYSESDYFAAVAEEKPLLHTWSLAVEEQYYLLFPPLLAVAMRWGRRVALWFILVCAIASIAYATFGNLEPEGRFFLTHTRIWELLVGSLCAYVMLYHPPKGNALWAAIGLGLIVFAIFAFSHDTPYPAFAIPPVAGTALIILFATPDSMTARILSMRAFVGIGLISFSAYLWHQPLFAFARIKSVVFPDPWLMALLAVLSLVLAAVSWRYVEQPFRGAPARLLPSRRGIFGASLAGILAFVLVGYYGHEKDGFPDREIIRNLSQPMIDARYERFRTWDVLTGEVPARFDLADFGEDTGKANVLLVGDSHSKGLFNAIYQNPDLFPNVNIRQISMNFGCYEHASNKAELEACLEEFLSISATLLAKTTHVVFAARWHRPGRLNIMANVPTMLQDRGIKMYLAGQNVEYDTEAPVMIHEIARDIRFDGKMAFPRQRTNKKFYSERSELALNMAPELQQIAQAHNMTYLDRYALVCDDTVQECSGITPDGKAVSYDYGHWTLAGSKYFGQIIAERNWLPVP